jgi:hypothetical protein
MVKAKNIPEFIKNFTEGTVKNLEQFRTYLVYDYGDLQVLQYKRIYEKEDWYGWEKQTVKDEEILAYRFQDGSCICNANELRTTGYGTIYRASDREGENQIQKILQHYGAVPLPFTLFTESNLDVRDFSWVCKPTPETVTVLREKTVYNNETREYDHSQEAIDRHFVGAAIFKIEDEIFFFDVDRQELEHGIFNAFITKIPKIATTIKGAYDLLMPDEVRTAIQEGTEVLRQGEFFFVKIPDISILIPVLTEEEKEILKYKPTRIGFINPSEIDRYHLANNDRKFSSNEPTSPEREAFNKAMDKYLIVEEKATANIPRDGTLGKSSSASHHVKRYIKLGEDVFVSGTISQSRREHADLNLSGWYKVIPNTGVFSWTITGRID